MFSPGPTHSEYFYIIIDFTFKNFINLLLCGILQFLDETLCT